MKGPSKEFVVTLAVIGVVLYVLLAPVFAQPRFGHRRGVIGLLKQQGLGIVMYAGDFDDRLPLRDTWMDATFPYGKSEQVYQDPSLSIDGKAPPHGKFGFAFFEPLAGIDMTVVIEPEAVPLVFQSRPVDRNATGGLELLPNPPRSQSAKEEGTNAVCYLDTHVKEHGAEWPSGPTVLRFKKKTD